MKFARRATIPSLRRRLVVAAPGFGRQNDGGSNTNAVMESVALAKRCSSWQRDGLSNGFSKNFVKLHGVAWFGRSKRAAYDQRETEGKISMK
jgi:hypothetical protein